VTQADPLAILADLGVSAPNAVTPVSGGWDTALWRVDAADGRRYALRVFRPEQARTCRREALVMRGLSDVGVPVPEVYAEGVSRNRPALLMQWCEGRPILQDIAARPWRAWRLGVAMGRVHARIHAVSVADALTDELPRINVGNGPPSVLHMDYHPLNVMTDGRSITGVLDWANVAIGDRRLDLARSVTILRLAPTPPGTPVLLLRTLRGILESAWRSGYCQARQMNPFVDMDPLYAWAGEWMERDLRPKLGRPGVWLQESDLSRIHDWTLARRGESAP
jgi:aminoglycoside phosphotransferase (APT) family kinase protein